MRRLFLFISIMLLFLSGCYSLQTEGYEIEEDIESSDITLKFINSWGGLDSNAEGLQKIFDDFMEENPNIKIQNESVGGSGFLTKIKTDFATNNDPDVFGIWPGSDMNALINAGKVADLTDVINADTEWKNSFGSEAWDYCTSDGKIYGLPVEIIYEALFINTEIFEMYDVEAPETFEDLCILSRMFANKGIVPIAYNYEAEGTYLYQNIIAQLGGKEGVENVDECYRDALYKMYILYDIRAFSDEAYRLSNAQRNELFLDGKAAMIVQGSWFTKDIYEAGMGNKVEIVPFPSFKETQRDGYCAIYGLGCGTFFMSQKAWDDPEKREACIALLRALTSPEASATFSRGSGFISNIDMSSIIREETRLYAMGQELIKNAECLAPPPDSIVERNLWEDVIVKSFPEIYSIGEEAIEELWGIISEDN